MAKTPQNTTLTLLIILLISIFSFLSLTTADEYYNTFPNKELGFKREKLTHLHFYFHDVVSGRNPTAVKVAEAATTNTSSTNFGYVAVLDDPLTVGPNATSKQVGRAQGIYGSASQSEVGLLMVLNYVFTEGKYNGSTLSILGHNAILSAVREMPVVGGSGRFRFARGYAEARTYMFNATTLDAVVEYNVYVSHY
ncbi:Disease resistance response protein [Parasponia andersonii]|uniref:Dirigent protein n=1 Tax=Parasponia andersonii TaxID=3476 RepID=A0A2P5DSD1_PARAD|nr:Disease resistance response protein [Parasponia andersonii]